MTTALPLPVKRSLTRLGQNISKARRRRKWDHKTFAALMGVSVSTVKRLEAGTPGLALHTMVSALHAFGKLDAFEMLLDTPNDTIGLIQQDEGLPKRVRNTA